MYSHHQAEHGFVLIVEVVNFVSIIQSCIYDVCIIIMSCTCHTTLSCNACTIQTMHALQVSTTSISVSSAEEPLGTASLPCPQSTKQAPLASSSNACLVSVYVCGYEKLGSDIFMPLCMH